MVNSIKFTKTNLQNLKREWDKFFMLSLKRKCSGYTFFSETYKQCDS